MIYLFAGNIYEILGGEKFLSEAKEAISALDTFWQRDKAGFKKVFLEYVFELNDELERVGLELPEKALLSVREERARRRSESKRESKLFELPDQSVVDAETLSFMEEEKKMWREIPMNEEVGEILDGKWDGKVHWALD